MCDHGCLDGDVLEGEEISNDTVSGGRKMMFTSSETVNRSDCGGKMCRDGFIGGDIHCSMDSGFAEEEHISSDHRKMNSTSEARNRGHDGGVICQHECLEDDTQQSKGRGRTQHEHLSGRQSMHSTIVAAKSSEAKICRHGVLTTETLDSNDDDDNTSQERNESQSYNKANLVKTMSCQNVSQFPQTSDDFQIELSENDEEALKEELMHIFDRERTTLEMYFRTKMDERLREFRGRQIQFEEATRAEKVELENNMSIEKMEMQKTFAEEIAKLTHSFNEERQQLEVYYKEHLKDLREKLETEQKQMDEKFSREKMQLKEKLEAEFQAKFSKEISHEKQEAARQKIELEARFHKEKLELEKSYNIRLGEAESSLEKHKAEFEAKLTQERTRMEKQSQDNIMELDAKLQEERRLRQEKERELEQDNARHSNEDSLNKKENERLRKDVDVLRQKNEEKDRVAVQLKSFAENIRVKGREGLEGKLKDDFERLLEDHKMELDKNYHRDKEKIDETLQAERRRMKEEQEREKEKIKLEQDEIKRKKERLRAEEKALTDRQQQQRGDSELLRPRLGDHRVELASEKPDRGVHQEQRDVSDWARPHLGEHHIHIASGTEDRGVQQQHRVGSKLLGPTLSSHDIKLASGTTDWYNNHQYLTDEDNGTKGDPHVPSPSPQQHQRRQLGSTSHPYVVQHGGASRNPQYNVKDGPSWQSYHQANYEDHEKQELPRNQSLVRESGAGSIQQSKQRDNSLYLVSPENERVLQSEIMALRSENEGLKAKVIVLEENIELHKKYKEEAKAEMERLLKANEENELKIQNLTREFENSGKWNTENMNIKGREYGAQVKWHADDDRTKTAGKNAWELEGKMKGLEARADRAKKREKEYEAQMRPADDPRKEKRKEDDMPIHWGVSRQKDRTRYESEPTNDKDVSQYKAKYEATLREKNKLLQVTKDLQTKIKALQERQTEILRQSSHLERSSDQSGETERLKQLVSENSSLKERTSALQNQLQRLLEKLKNEKEKATSLESELSSQKSRNLHTIQDLQEKLVHTSQELTGSHGDVNPDALRRIEKEIMTIGQIVKTNFRGGSVDHVSYRSTNEDVARIAQLEVEKKELETKLKIAREAMNEYVTRLSEKMQDVKSMSGVSEEMAQEFHNRNNSLMKSLQALEEGQKTSHLQNEQLRHEKSVLQNLIGDMCCKHEGGSDDVIGTSYNTAPKYQEYKYETKYGRSCDNRYDEDFERKTDRRYLSKEFKEFDGDKYDRGSKLDRFSTVFVEYPSRYSTFEY